MKLLPDLLKKEGWHLDGAGLPIQVGVRSARTPFGGRHLHRTMAEYFLLLAGNLKLQVDDEVLEMTPGDLVVVEPGEVHQVLQASPDALLFLVMPAPVPHDKVDV